MRYKGIYEDEWMLRGYEIVKLFCSFFLCIVVELLVVFKWYVECDIINKCLCGMFVVVLYWI